jgi:hypothetical protein
MMTDPPRGHRRPHAARRDAAPGARTRVRDVRARECRIVP